MLPWVSTKTNPGDRVLTPLDRIRSTITKERTDGLAGMYVQWSKLDYLC